MYTRTFSTFIKPSSIKKFLINLKKYRAIIFYLLPSYTTKELIEPQKLP